MASHTYLRALAAPSIAPLVGMQPAVRVKLVFADALATFVMGHRGFSSCWYLIPHTARLVGDLMHEIAEEFELLERCPRGMEMVLDGFHVLANQPIEMVRDNDTLVVQCSSFVAETSRPKESKAKKTKRSTSVESEEEDDKRVSKKAKTTNAVLRASGKVKKTSIKAVKAAPASSDSSSSSSDDSSDDEDEKVVRPARTTTKKITQKTAVAASQRTESSSEDSSSSEDEKAAPPTPKQRAFKALVKDTVKAMNQEVVTMQSSNSSSSSSSSSDSDTSSDSSDSYTDEPVRPVQKSNRNGAKATTSNGKQTVSAGDEQSKGTRRRRRPRRRPKGDTAGETTAVVNGAKPKSATLPLVAARPAAQQTETPKEIRPLRIRGVPAASKQGGQLHMRFDGASKPVVLPPPVPAREVSSDLQKYGPAPVRTSKKPSDLNMQTSEEAVPTTKKKPVKEMWKRPYEIISSIHDETPAGNTATSTKTKPTVDALVASFPPKPSDVSSLPTPSGLQADDIIAYKTLTLCMETWQPIVSAWKCGKVLSLQDSDNTVVIQPHNWILPATSDGQLAWEASTPTEDEDTQASISISEVSDLRYLQGPTKAYLTTPAS